MKPRIKLILKIIMFIIMLAIVFITSILLVSFENTPVLYGILYSLHMVGCTIVGWFFNNYSNYILDKNNYSRFLKKLNKYKGIIDKWDIIIPLIFLIVFICGVIFIMYTF